MFEDNILRLSAPAKINLFLRLLHKRADNYHELQTAFQFLDLCDFLELSLKADYGIELFYQSGDELISCKENLVLDAARLLAAYAGVGHKNGVRIILHKNIPVGAGLGGGSSDAAATLLGLNRLWGCGLSNITLARLGARLGADVAVFVHGQASYATGIGDILLPHNFDECNYLLVVPAMVSTANIFNDSRLQCNNSRLPWLALLSDDVIANNSFETLVRTLYPDVDAAFHYLGQFSKPQLSGSGGGVFALIKNMSKIQSYINNMPNKKWKIFKVRGLNRSPLTFI